MGGTTLATSDNALQLFTWTRVTVFYGYGSGFGTAAININDVLQTPSLENKLMTATTFAEATTDNFRIGGFKGSLKIFRVYSPGGIAVNTASIFLFLDYSNFH